MNNYEKTAKFLYEQAVASEIYPEELEGESLAIQEMLEEIRSLGFPFYYFADIRFRNIKEPQIMEILLKYYDRMESIYTKGDMLIKIDPKKYPIALEIALKEYNDLTPLGKKDISHFQEVLSKGKVSRDYISMLLSLLEIPDNYASSFLLRDRLLKIAPESLKALTYFYSKGVLLPATLKEFAVYNDNESLKILFKAAEVTEDNIIELKKCSSYNLCPTMYEYWSACCYTTNIRSEAKKLLKRRMKLEEERQEQKI